MPAMWATRRVLAAAYPSSSMTRLVVSRIMALASSGVRLIRFSDVAGIGRESSLRCRGEGSQLKIVTVRFAPDDSASIDLDLPPPRSPEAGFPQRAISRADAL